MGGRSVPQGSLPGEIDLCAEARNAHAVPDLSGSRLADWLGERRKCQQGSRRSTPQRSRHALGSAERQPHTRATQCGLQSAVERDLDDIACSSTSASHESAASRQPAAAHPRLLDPRLLGSTAVSDVPSTCSPWHFNDSSCSRAATGSSSWLWLFLAQAFSQTASFQPCASRRGLCKKMNRTLWPYGHLEIRPVTLSTCAPLSVNSAKGLARRAERSFASLRMTARTPLKSAHGRSYLQTSGDHTGEV